MMFMPLVFGYMFYFASAGLVLYWLTGNLVGIVQQWLLERDMPAARSNGAKSAIKEEETGNKRWPKRSIRLPNPDRASTSSSNNVFQLRRISTLTLP